MSESSQDSKDSRITSMKTQELQTPQSDSVININSVVSGIWIYTV